MEETGGITIIEYASVPSASNVEPETVSPSTLAAGPSTLRRAQDVRWSGRACLALTCQCRGHLLLRAITIIRRVDGVYGSESNPPYTRS